MVENIVVIMIIGWIHAGLSMVLLELLWSHEELEELLLNQISLYRICFIERCELKN